MMAAEEVVGVVAVGPGLRLGMMAPGEESVSVSMGSIVGVCLKRSLSRFTVSLVSVVGREGRTIFDDLQCLFFSICRFVDFGKTES